jgi:3'(2'), 5'-bisphosphate nucleotidase
MPSPAAEAVELEALILIAMAAGKEIMAVRAGRIDARAKADGSLVTEADERAEAVIGAALARLAPGVPMIGEEAAAAGRAPDPGALFFCVDPLDGTRDFVGADRGEFTVNIALIADGAPVKGVVLAPATGEVFAGEPGRAVKGRWAGGDAAPALAPIGAARTRPANGWRVIASRHSGANDSTARFIAALGDTQCANSSSSIKFCRLAEGGADIYPRFGDVCEWDIAAGHAVLAAVGGSLMDLHGAPLRYGKRAEMFLVPGFVACANDAAAEAARAALLTPSP